MSKKLLKTPWTLPGAVCQQQVKCGKKSCHCARGELHGPYFYRFWRENGRLQKEYVSPANLARVRAACAKHRRERHERVEAMRYFRKVSSYLRRMGL